jgi:hypothetical protein
MLLRTKRACSVRISNTSQDLYLTENESTLVSERENIDENIV